MRAIVLLALLMVVSGCASRSPDVVVVSSAPGGRQPRSATGIPPGQYPPPGQCRIWIPGRPPGRQPRAARCESLVGQVPRGAFLLYNSAAWDSDYDWNEHARRNPGTVPDIVIRVIVSKRSR